MALFFECMPECARKLLDTADIVRDAIYRQLRVLRKHPTQTKRAARRGCALAYRVGCSNFRSGTGTVRQSRVSVRKSSTARPAYPARTDAKLHKWHIRWTTKRAAVTRRCTESCPLLSANCPRGPEVCPGVRNWVNGYQISPKLTSFGSSEPAKKKRWGW